MGKGKGGGGEGLKKGEGVEGRGRKCIPPRRVTLLPKLPDSKHLATPWFRSPNTSEKNADKVVRTNIRGSTLVLRLVLCLGKRRKREWKTKAVVVGWSEAAAVAVAAAVAEVIVLFGTPHPHSYPPRPPDTGWLR